MNKREHFFFYYLLCSITARRRRESSRERKNVFIKAQHANGTRIVSEVNI